LIRAIFFDLDDTLWDVHPVIVRAEHALLDFLRVRYPRVTERHGLESMRAVRVEMARAHPAMRHDFTWLRLESLRHHAREAGYAETLAEEAFEVFYRARNGSCCSTTCGRRSTACTATTGCSPSATATPTSARSASITTSRRLSPRATPAC
jgi:FMN phosphatase YigB (HAD superfamily)